MNGSCQFAPRRTGPRTTSSATTRSASHAETATVTGIVVLLLIVHLACTLSRWAAPREQPLAHHAQLRLDPNYATAAELALLPRIGPALAATIIEYRTQSAHQPAFRALADLDAVPRIGPATLAALAPYLTFDPAGPSSTGAESE